MLSDTELRELADRLVAMPDSDVDLGVYYRPPLDVEGLELLAASLAEARCSRPPTLTRPGAWGPLEDGGGWLSIPGVAVDWIYRDLDRVQQSWASARQGSFAFHFQVGHPLGVPDFAYAGEVALGVVLADPTGELTATARALVAEVRERSDLG